ncbi:MAG: T9SS type A sorting domain-containing protein [Ignavibacteriae bacterium]|nr:T9SS type A sorting domain-containing protein [Ignavibacteriota bacterium]
MSIGSNLFAGILNGGVALSTNSGTTWTLVRTGLPLQGIVYHLLANDATSLYCGTDVRGVWKRPLSELVAVKEIASGTPATFSLEQNYPNPFNPTTMIRFTVPANVGTGPARTASAGGHALSLRVYDLLGREVATLVNQNLNAGSYETVFSAEGLPSGAYFYTLRTAEFVQTKRMTLLK